jgi:hypothetical protein
MYDRQIERVQRIVSAREREKERERDVVKKEEGDLFYSCLKLVDVRTFGKLPESDSGVSAYKL